jgi:hypothetical protein
MMQYSSAPYVNAMASAGRITHTRRVVKLFSDRTCIVKSDALN